MSGSYLAGKNGSITTGSGTPVVLNLSEWSIDMDGDAPDITTFVSNGSRENIFGLQEATITAKGPYYAGATALTIGNSYQFNLDPGNSTYKLTVTARLTKIGLNTNIDDATRINITAKSTGALTAAVT